MPIRIPTGSEHLELVNVYRRSLRTDTIDTIIDRTLCQETCFCVDLATRRSIADSVFKFFKITNAELNFVGSAQLGFSLLQKGDRPRYRAFSIESDLDIAIVSSSFFDEVWESTFVHFIE